MGPGSGPSGAVSETGTPKASIVWAWFDRAVPSSILPWEARSRVATRSATRIGWLKASSGVDTVRRWMRSVRPAISPRTTSGADMVSTSEKWTSASP